VPRDLHGDALRNAGPDHVADCGAPEVVRNPTGQPAVLHAFFHALRMDVIGFPFRWNTCGTSLPVRVSASCSAHWPRHQSPISRAGTDP
jgi:hypothetical protein